MKKYFLLICIAISLFFSFYKIHEVPPCLNADEVAFGYNSYSLLKTGRDEYGAFMPMRLVSFRDYKLPLYSYLSMPFMMVFGLTDFSTRALNIIIAALVVPLVYLLLKELFDNETIAIIGAFLTSISPWIYILTRHAHEGPLSIFFILLSLYYVLRFYKKRSFKSFLLINITIVLATYSYQSARLFLLCIILAEFFMLLRNYQATAIKKSATYFLVLFFVIIISFFPDITYGVNRVQNLFFIKSPGFTLRLNEYLGDHPNRLIHNKLTEGIRDVTNRYMAQISPEFLTIHGDKNWRFGFDNMGLITPIEYVLIGIGLYYMFVNKEKYRYLIVLFLLISPIPNVLTWQDASLIRTYILIFPIIFCTSYGVYYLYWSLKKGFTGIKSLLLVVIIIGVFGFYVYNNWDIYFNHYPMRAVIARAWQCGYKELAQYIKANYNNYDQFNITTRNGQPYIYILYYLQIDPAAYQRQSKISGPDKYGFGQIERFDKFNFKFSFDKAAKKTVFIGYPDEFNDLSIDMAKIKKITIGTEEIFWIYET